MPETHGGKRNGSGRRSRDTKRVAITVRFEADVAAAFRDHCKSRGVSQSEMIAHWIKNSKTKKNDR